MSPLVTAVIPTYNYARFVARAVESVLGQTYPAIECVVVDDGSRDETPQVLEQFGSRIRVIRQPNRGLSAARNTGIAAASGPYVAFLDSDDCWYPEKIERQMALIRSAAELGCVGCGFAHVSPDGSVEEFPGRRNNRSQPETLRLIALRKFWVGGSGSGALVRREVLQRVGPFDERLSAAEDWDMWMRLSVTTRIDNVEAVSVAINKHGTGVFRNVRRMEDNQQAVYEKAIRAWPEALPVGLRRRVRALILADAARESIGIGRPDDALVYYRRSLAVWPFSYRQARATTRLMLRGMAARVSLRS